MKKKPIADAAVRAVIRKRKRRARRRVIGTVCLALFCLTLGIFIGIHRRVIAALLTGEPMPATPEGHPDLCKFAERIKSVKLRLPGSEK